MCFWKAAHFQVSDIIPIIYPSILPSIPFFNSCTLEKLRQMPKHIENCIAYHSFKGSHSPIPMKNSKNKLTEVTPYNNHPHIIVFMYVEQEQGN